MPWECTFSAVHLHKPQYMPLIAYPVSHTRGTNGKVIEDAVYINTEEITSESDLGKYRGRLRGKIVLTKPKPKLGLDFKPRATRLSKAVLVEPSMVKSRLDGPFDKGIVYLRSGRPIPLARLTMAAEHYNRIVRLLEKGMDEWMSTIESWRMI